MLTSGASRSSLGITLSVWKGLFFRESLARLFSARAAWFWLLVEPVAHVAYLVFIFTAVRVRTVGGIDTTIWIIVGLLAFFTFRRTGMQVMSAINANQALFAYRQVKPVDPALVRGGMEGLLMVVVTFLLLSGAALLGHDALPADPLAVFEAFFGLWLLGLGFGLVGSVLDGLVPEAGQVLRFSMMPMYFISGVVFPINLVPYPYREWLMLNPVVHGLEAARLGFAPYYHAIPELSIAYLYGFALFINFLGLALHRRFAQRLVTQ